MTVMDSSTVWDEVLGWLEPVGAGLAVVAMVALPQLLDAACPLAVDVLGALSVLAGLCGLVWFLTRR